MEIPCLQQQPPTSSLSAGIGMGGHANPPSVSLMQVFLLKDLGNNTSTYSAATLTNCEAKSLFHRNWSN